MEYYEFIGAVWYIGDIIKTCDGDSLRVNDVIVDTMSQLNGGDGYDYYEECGYCGGTGILYTDEDGTEQFLPHGEIYGVKKQKW